MPSTTINKHALKTRLEEKLLDKCLDFQSAGGGSHHLTYTASMERLGKIFIRVQSSIFEDCGMVSPKSLPSEVSTMRYVKLNTDIPVPDVLLYDMDTDGLVGGSWMATEFISGNNLWNLWSTLTPSQKETLCLRIADMWSTLIQLTGFDAIGSIYETSSGAFEIGAMMCLPSNRAGALAPPDSGPFRTAKDWLVAQARKDLDYKYVSTTSEAVTRQTFIDAVVHDIEDFAFPSDDLPFVLEHIDFGFHNMIVAQDDPTRIMGLVDWEGARVVPLWAANGAFRFPSCVDEPEPLEGRRRFRKVIQDRLFGNPGRWREAVSAEFRSVRQLQERSQLSDWDPDNYVPQDVIPFSPDVGEDYL
ncbi:hypothetical protein BDZ89DRAFT_1165200 [Hymenopellis radicata]|nr:hypothetical protein BDZ89DRAFT_1165200 [Hymenopellis radicata]